VALTVGDQVDRYRIEAILGTGQMATVYAARHTVLDKRHAIKLLHNGTPELQERLVREGRVQASLAHPNVLAVNDVFMHANTPALLMELVEGPDLETWLQHHRPSVDEALAIFGGILSAARAAHAIGVTHRDLKPGNILLHVSADGVTPKVADFGLAKALDPGGTRRTAVGVSMGTPQYMAPEQIKDAKNADARADIFSLGCILYELVCGRRCFEGADVLEVYRKVSQGSYPPPRSFVPNLPYHVATAIEKALDIDLTKRCQDADELGRLLYNGGVWPQRLAHGTQGANVAATLLQRRRHVLGSAQVQSPAGGKGSGQVLDEMTKAAKRSTAQPARSTGPLYAMITAVMLLVVAIMSCAIVLAYFLLAR